ncbi:MAG: helix-turn-helix domain-containing protein [Actinomycetota bacterium]|nr:helix-turn-helix domain-containing protein [Actinomycetota bacterium]
MAGTDDWLRPLLVDAKQAARLLGIGRTTLYELINAGAIMPMHIGRCVRFPMTELERFVATGCVIDAEPLLVRKQAAARARQRNSDGARANGPSLRLFDPAG